MCGVVKGESPTASAGSKATKAELLAALKASFDYCDPVYESMTMLSRAELDEIFGPVMPGIRWPPVQVDAAHRACGPASAGTSGIRSTPADSAWDAGISGKSPDVHSVEQRLRRRNGTWTIRMAITREVTASVLAVI